MTAYKKAWQRKYKDKGRTNGPRNTEPGCTRIIKFVSWPKRNIRVEQQGTSVDDDRNKVERPKHNRLCVQDS